MQIPDEKKLSEPGIYPDISNEFYHADCCAGPSLSSTGAAVIEERSLAHFFEDSCYNPDRKPPKPKTYFRIGACIHSLLLEGALPDNVVLKKFDAFRTNEAKAWRDEQLNAGRIILSKDEYNDLCRMAETFMREPLVKEYGLLDGMAEQTVIAIDEETGVYLKARPDNLKFDRVMVEYKSQSDARARSNYYKIKDFAYHQRLAFYAEVIFRAEGQAFDTFLFAIQESSAPFSVSFVDLDIDIIAYQALKNRSAIRKFAKCMDEWKEAQRKGDDYFWPGYSHAGIQTLTMAGNFGWEKERMDKAQEAGELPKFSELPKGMLEYSGK